MGAKTASKPRLRSIAYKCDLCGRKFTKLDALKSHQRIVHHLEPKLKSKLLGNKNKRQSVKKVANIKQVTSESISSNNNQETISTKKDVADKQDVVEFECPKCFRTFPKYFPALKHIQKFHCVNRQGTRVPANSPFLIQPVRIELCRKCNRKVKSIPTHVCDAMILHTKTESLTYTCAACEGSFATLRSFDIHVVSLHGDNMESLFFPTNVEFSKWKLEMENQTKAKYTLVDKYEFKCFYHCNFKTTDSTNNTIKLCPSTIVVQELSKGIQVSLYKNHYNHNSVNYKLGNKYKKFGLNSIINRPIVSTDINDSKYDEDDFYIHFKTVMENIIFDAAKVDIFTLNVLLAKASEMTSTITSYEEKMSDNEESGNSKNMNESDILNALMDSKVIKRKSVTKPKIEYAKHPRVDEILTNPQDELESAPAPKIVNFYSLANSENTLKEVNKIENDINIPQTETENGISTLVVDSVPQSEVTQDSSPNLVTKKSPHILDKPFSSFDESYADFLSKNFVVTKENLNTLNETKRTRSSLQTNIKSSVEKNRKPIQNNAQNKKKNEKKPVMKTKMGQFKGVSPKKDVSKSIDNDVANAPKKELLVTAKSMPSTPIKHIPKVPKTLTNPPKKHNNTNLPKKRKSKTAAKPRFSLKKPKIDIVYEVKEQEDDCNILILKI